mgnify:CR=1 FL=1
MDSWIFDAILVSIAVLLMLFAVYKLLFSAEEQARRDLLMRPKPRFERRQAERADRRQRSEPPPEGIDRRVSQRR